MLLRVPVSGGVPSNDAAPPQTVRISDHTETGADHAIRVRVRPAWCKMRTPEAGDKQVLVERCIRSWGCPGTAAGRSSASTGHLGSNRRTCPPRQALECKQVGDEGMRTSRVMNSAGTAGAGAAAHACGDSWPCRVGIRVRAMATNPRPTVERPKGHSESTMCVWSVAKPKPAIRGEAGGVPTHVGCP